MLASWNVRKPELGHKFTQHKTINAALQVSQTEPGIKIIDISAMAIPAVETHAIRSFVQRIAEKLRLGWINKPVSEIAQVQSSFLFTLLCLISVAYL